MTLLPIAQRVLLRHVGKKQGQLLGGGQGHKKVWLSLWLTFQRYPMWIWIRATQPLESISRPWRAGFCSVPPNSYLTPVFPAVPDSRHSSYSLFSSLTPPAPTMFPQPRAFFSPSLLGKPPVFFIWRSPFQEAFLSLMGVIMLSCSVLCGLCIAFFIHLQHLTLQMN